MTKLTNKDEWLNQQLGNDLSDQRLFLSEEEVRSFPQFKDATPEEVENIIGTLHDLALVCYEQFCRETRKDADSHVSKPIAAKFCESPLISEAILPVTFKRWKHNFK